MEQARTCAVRAVNERARYAGPRLLRAEGLSSTARLDGAPLGSPSKTRSWALSPSTPQARAPCGGCMQLRSCGGRLPCVQSSAVGGRIGLPGGGGAVEVRPWFFCPLEADRRPLGRGASRVRRTGRTAWARAPTPRHPRRRRGGVHDAHVPNSVGGRPRREGGGEARPPVAAARPRQGAARGGPTRYDGRFRLCLCRRGWQPAPFVRALFSPPPLLGVAAGLRRPPLHLSGSQQGAPLLCVGPGFQSSLPPQAVCSGVLTPPPTRRWSAPVLPLFCLLHRCAYGSAPAYLATSV